MIVEQFLRWMTMVGPEQRAQAVPPLTRAYFRSELTREERDGLEALMTVLLDDADPGVRLALAEAIVDEPDAPHPLVLALAQDRTDIAATVVARSPVLLDAELVDLVALGGEEIQYAAATRPTVSPALAAALAEVGEPSALEALLRNRRAAIPHFSLARIVERAGQIGEIRDALLARSGVPIGIRQSLLDQLSSALRGLVTERAWMSQERADTVTRDAKDKATIALAAAAAADEIAPLVAHLRASGQLTTTLLLRSACYGNLRLLGEAIACLSGMPSSRVACLMASGREPAFRALYRKAGLPDRAYPAFLAAMEVNRDLGGDGAADELDDHAFAARVIAKVLDRCGQNQSAEFQDLIVLLRRFATEVARDAARSFMSRSLERPLALAPSEPANDETTATSPAAWADVEDPFGLEHAMSRSEDVADVLASYTFPDEEPSVDDAPVTSVIELDGWDATLVDEDPRFAYARGIKAA